MFLDYYSFAALSHFFLDRYFCSPSLPRGRTIIPGNATPFVSLRLLFQTCRSNHCSRMSTVSACALGDRDTALHPQSEKNAGGSIRNAKCHYEKNIVIFENAVSLLITICRTAKWHRKLDVHTAVENESLCFFLTDAVHFILLSIHGSGKVSYPH